MLSVRHALPVAAAITIILAIPASAGPARPGEKGEGIVDPLERALGFDTNPTVRTTLRERSAHIDAQLLDGNEMSPAAKDIIDLEQQLDVALDEYWNEIAASPAFAGVRQSWVDCVGGRFASEPELLGAADRLSDDGEQSAADALFAESERCKAENASEFNELAVPVADRWAVEHKALLAEYLAARL